MSQPSAQVSYNSLCKTKTETPVTITLSNNNLVRISQLTMNVYPGVVKIEEAEFFISLMPEVSFGTYLKNLAREQLLNSPRLVTGVAWQSQSIIPPVAVVQGSIDQVGYDQAVANAIRVQVFGNRVETLKPRVGAFAIPLFTIEGHDNAYCTDFEKTSIPLRQNYAMIVSVAGLNLPETDRLWFRVELRDWNHIRVTPDTTPRRLLRKARSLL